MFGYEFKRWDVSESVEVNPKKDSLEDAAKWTKKQWTTENSREEKLSYKVQWSVLSVAKLDTLKETVKIGLNSEKKPWEIKQGYSRAFGASWDVFEIWNVNRVSEKGCCKVQKTQAKLACILSMVWCACHDICRYWWYCVTHLK